MIKTIFVAPCILLLMTSCIKEITSKDLMEEPAILTQYDTNVDFTQFDNFAIVDSISIITDDQTIENRIATSDALQVLNRISNEMTERGYAKINPINADIGINVSIIHELNIQTGTSLVPGYWWGYDGYWGADYWGYPSDPFYYSYDYNYIYDSGALLIEFYDLKNASSANKLKVIWNAEIGDIFNSNINLSEGLESISQAFNQSLYLQH